ncbi:hypothetical protein BUV99_04395 [Corynebacterium diphtheriae]|nr:hypothetical protein BUV99_04395 [Corynebacterium diphtheriae]OLO22947.1 hypothetical protein BVH76_04410 [Corynebacterium diphtheriae]
MGAPPPFTPEKDGTSHQICSNGRFGSDLCECEKNPSKYPRLVALPVLGCIDCVSDVGGVEIATFKRKIW